ncbi:MAG TPA: SusD/RagB family nutrient-binding outer membrane lipoprotein [Puia sp.]|nr:SusD/RagB family nutrient-binding outer membrane lipoprotein [Puia sp.]
MKNYSIIIGSLALLAIGCTKPLSSLNVDPKSSTSAIAAALFTQAQKKFADVNTTTAISVSPFRIISQEWTENSYTYESVYDFAVYDCPDGFWNSMYINLIQNADLAKQAFPVNFQGTPGALRNDLAITDLLEIYAYGELVATYGDIPYSEAENKAIPFPKYDDAKTIYTDLLMRLDTCIAALNVGESAMGSADLIYSGSVAQWIKFAASLKLRMAMLLADTDPTTAASKVNEALTTGVFQSNTDNALFAYDPASPGNSNPIWAAISYSGRHDFVPANLLVSTMVGWNDPRLPYYFTQYNGSYSGGNPGQGNGYGLFSDFGAALYSASLPGDLLDYAEVEFYLAEAVERGFIPGSAGAYYNNAITASIQFWGDNNPADASAYLAQPSVNYATAAGTWKQKIGYQEWIASYNRNWESWTLIRRLGYPDIDVVSPPIGEVSTFPLRLYYPINEVSSNPINWAAAAKKLPGGEDVVTAKPFWMP